MRLEQHFGLVTVFDKRFGHAIEQVSAYRGETRLARVCFEQ